MLDNKKMPGLFLKRIHIDNVDNIALDVYITELTFYIQEYHLKGGKYIIDKQYVGVYPKIMNKETKQSLEKDIEKYQDIWNTKGIDYLIKELESKFNS